MDFFPKKVYSTHKLNQLKQYEVFKILFWDIDKIFDYYHEDIRKLNCIDDEIIVCKENIFELCWNFINNNINYKNKAKENYFNNLGKKKYILENYNKLELIIKKTLRK